MHSLYFTLVLLAALTVSSTNEQKCMEECLELALQYKHQECGSNVTDIVLCNLPPDRVLLNTCKEMCHESNENIIDNREPKVEKEKECAEGTHCNHSPNRPNVTTKVAAFLKQSRDKFNRNYIDNKRIHLPNNQIPSRRQTRSIYDSGYRHETKSQRNNGSYTDIWSTEIGDKYTNFINGTVSRGNYNRDVGDKNYKKYVSEKGDLVVVGQGGYSHTDSFDNVRSTQEGSYYNNTDSDYFDDHRIWNNKVGDNYENENNRKRFPVGEISYRNDPAGINKYRNGVAGKNIYNYGPTDRNNYINGPVGENSYSNRVPDRKSNNHINLSHSGYNSGNSGVYRRPNNGFSAENSGTEIDLSVPRDYYRERCKCRCDLKSDVPRPSYTVISSPGF